MANVSLTSNADWTYNSYGDYYTIASWKNTTNSTKLINSFSCYIGTGAGPFTWGENTWGNGDPFNTRIKAICESASPKFQESEYVRITNAVDSQSGYGGYYPVYEECKKYTFTFSNKLRVPSGGVATFQIYCPSASDQHVLCLSKRYPNTDNITLSISDDTYVITYNANGHGRAPAPMTVNAGISVWLETISVAGYNFEGWYTAASGGTRVGGAGDYYTPSGNITLYAHWSAKPIIVTFDPNGGSVDTFFKSVTYGDTYGTLPVPTYQGYTFQGWYISQSGAVQITSSSIVSLTSSHTLYAHWTPNFQFSIQFNGNGGTIYNPSTSQVGSSLSYYKEQGSTYIIPRLEVTWNSDQGEQPGTSTHIFLGWATSSTATTATYFEGSTYSSDAPLTLYAVWRTNTYTVTFVDSHTGNEVVLKTQTVNAGGNGTPPANPVWQGHTFSGWLGEYRNVNSNQKVVAMWDNSTIWIRRNGVWVKYTPKEDN